MTITADGWIEGAPGRWTRGRIKNLITSATNGTWGGEPAEDGSDVRCIRAADFDRVGRRAKVDGAPLRSIDASSLRQHLLHPGDLILEKSGGGEKQPVGMAVLYEGVEKAVCSNFCSRISPESDIDSRFLTYVFAAAYGQGLTQSAIKQATGIQNLDAGAFFSAPWAYPGLEEQCRIADFLDAETARIDALTRAYARLKGLVSERSQRVVDLEIDRHQNLTPFRYLVRFREGPGIMAVDFRNAGIPLIRISGLQGGEVTLNGCNFLDPEKASRQWSQFRLKLGDRLISGSATMGGVSAVKDPTVIGAIPYTGLIILRPARQDVDMTYVEAFLRSSLFSRQIDALKTGAAMQHFGPTHLSQVQAPMPSHQEQLRIAENVQGALAYASRCDDLANRQLALLAERRQALITAAVTGQFDVSTASGRNVTDGVSA